MPEQVANGNTIHLSTALDTLAARERELLALAARPMSAKEIASETGLSVGTVNNYLSNAQRRLGARNRVEAVRMFRASQTDVVTKVHMNFPPVPNAQPSSQPSVSELRMPHGPTNQGLADSIAPRSRVSLEAFLGSSAQEPLRLPDPRQLGWQTRLCAILGIAIVASFLMASVVILLDALTRLATTT